MGRGLRRARHTDGSQRAPSAGCRITFLELVGGRCDTSDRRSVMRRLSVLAVLVVGGLGSQTGSATRAPAGAGVAPAVWQPAATLFSASPADYPMVGGPAVALDGRGRATAVWLYSLYSSGPHRESVVMEADWTAARGWTPPDFDGVGDRCVQGAGACGRCARRRGDRLDCCEGPSTRVVSARWAGLAGAANALASGRVGKCLAGRARRAWASTGHVDRLPQLGGRFLLLQVGNRCAHPNERLGEAETDLRLRRGRCARDERERASARCLVATERRVVGRNALAERTLVTPTRDLPGWNWSQLHAAGAQLAGRRGGRLGRATATTGVYAATDGCRPCRARSVRAATVDRR